MLRRFRQHDIRQVQDLAGLWDFAFLGDVEFDEVDPADIAFDDVMAIPGNFDATPKYADAHGVGAYGLTVRVADAAPHRLILDGVHHVGRVFVDGQALGDHVGGYTRWEVDFTPAGAGEVRIVVLTDNRLGYDRCPLHLDYFDWYHFGGISRGAELHRLGELCIDRLRVVTEDWQARRISVYVDFQGTSKPGDTPLKMTVDGQAVADETVTLDNRFARLKRTFELPGAALWSPDEPNLHDLHVTLGGDDMHERIGIRQVETAGQEIRINGQPVRLLGFNRHEAHPQFGCGLVDALRVADVQQLKEMGCNFVRGCHYPQDVRFLDLCDEMGICVWNESIGWQHTAEHLNDPRFVELQKLNAREMILAAQNRPSVILWGILNESHSHNADAQPGYAALLDNIRQLDPTRPVTYASNHPFEDLCYDLADVISINCYPGWYSDGIDQVGPHLDRIVEHIDGPAGQSDKPLIISEIGAGAIYGWRDWNERRWTEQYQAKHLTEVIEHMFGRRDRFAGLAIWQYGDCRTEETKAIGRPRQFNNKGVVDEYRRPKQAYFTVAELFEKFARS